MTEEFDPSQSEPIARKTLVLFYLIDTSGSMTGAKIGTVNTIMEEVIPEIRDVGGADSEVKVAVLDFNSTCNWMYQKPISVEDFTWNRLDAEGMTSLGAACRELNSKMSRSEFLQSASLSFSPVIFLLSDGEPTDDFKGGLAVLKKNKWFQTGLKVAVGIGNDANKAVLTEFTGNSESVLMVNNGKALANMIRFISVTSSEIGSKSIGFDDNNGQPITPQQANNAKQQAFNQQLQKVAADPNNLVYDDEWD